MEKKKDRDKKKKKAKDEAEEDVSKSGQLQHPLEKYKKLIRQVYFHTIGEMDMISSTVCISCPGSKIHSLSHSGGDL